MSRKLNCTSLMFVLTVLCGAVSSIFSWFLNNFKQKREKIEREIDMHAWYDNRFVSSWFILIHDSYFLNLLHTQFSQRYQKSSAESRFSYENSKRKHLKSTEKNSAHQQPTTMQNKCCNWNKCNIIRGRFVVSVT